MPVFFRDSANLPGGKRSSGGRTSYSHAKVEGWAALQKILNVDSILAQGNWRAGVTEATKFLFDTLQKRTPVGPKKSILKAERMEVQREGVPRWGRVEIPNLPTRAGFRYGGALQGSKRIAYRYRMGQYGGRVKYDRKAKTATIGQGKLTFHWWSGTRGAAQRGINRIFEKVNGAIERGWNRAA